MKRLDLSEEKDNSNSNVSEHRLSIGEVIANPVLLQEEDCTFMDRDPGEGGAAEAVKEFKESEIDLEHDDVFKAAKVLPKSCTVKFTFKDVSYTLKGGTRKVLLKGISGVVKPGELCAILGLSGSGMSKIFSWFVIFNG